MREDMIMTHQIELGLTYSGEEAEEFLRNEKNSSFTAEQISFFKDAKKSL